MSLLFKLFSKRIVGICTVTVLITACASTPQKTITQPNISYSIKNNHLHNDIWQRVRNGYKMPDLYNDDVEKKEAYYAQRAEYMIRMANRSGNFLYLIMNEVERRNMPSELALLPFVESAFVTTAQSPVKAAGLWQFMPATGKDFSLQQNHFADQRNNVIASTNAALTYLQQLYNMFGDWHLALAAYNWGQGNVSRAVRNARNSGYQGTYNDIKMPLETRQYVPKLQAIKNIIRNPSQFGLILPNISNSSRHEVVLVTRDIDVDIAARLSGMSVADFKSINPSFKKPVIAASLGSQLLIPKAYAERVRLALSNESEVIATLTTHSSYQTESLADIAARYKTNEDKLRQLNNIPYSHIYINSGSVLLVPRTSNKRNQDIPFSALTAGLSTNAGNASLMGGDHIEQPVFVAQNVSSFSNNSILSNNSSSNDDQLGLMIKNNIITSDPVRGQNAVVVEQQRQTTYPTANLTINQSIEPSIKIQQNFPSSFVPVNTTITPIITTNNVTTLSVNNITNNPSNFTEVPLTGVANIISTVEKPVNQNDSARALTHQETDSRDNKAKTTTTAPSKKINRTIDKTKPVKEVSTKKKTTQNNTKQGNAKSKLTKSKTGTEIKSSTSKKEGTKKENSSGNIRKAKETPAKNNKVNKKPIAKATVIKNTGKQNIKKITPKAKESSAKKTVKK